MHKFILFSNQIVIIRIQKIEIKIIKMLFQIYLIKIQIIINFIYNFYQKQIFIINDMDESFLFKHRSEFGLLFQRQIPEQALLVSLHHHRREPQIVLLFPNLDFIALPRIHVSNKSRMIHLQKVGIILQQFLNNGLGNYSVTGQSMNDRSLELLNRRSLRVHMQRIFIPTQSVPKGLPWEGLRIED